MGVQYPVRHPSAGASENTTDAADSDQLARDIAEIESAAAALREAEPALESWYEALAPQTLAKPRPVWLLIGALWVSTALVTLGAVVAISRLVG